MTGPVHTSRRAFLWLMGAGSVGAVLAACGGTAAPASSAPAASPNAPVTSKPAAASAQANAKPAASGATGTLKVAYVTTGGTHAPLWVAKEGGAFDKLGLKVEDQFLQASLGTKALIAKEVDLILQSAAPVITADLNGNADVAFIGSVLNHSQFALLVAPSIKTAGDLKGKAWATDKPGTTGDYQTRLLLKLLGLTTNDVVVRDLGGNDIPLQALISGQVQAAPMIPPFSFQGLAQGFTILKDTYDQAYQNVGVIAARSRIAEIRPALVNFLAGYREGIRLYNTQPELALKVLTKYTKETDDKINQQTYDFYKTQAPFQADLQPTLPGIQNMLEFLSATIPEAKNAKPEQFVDTSLLAELPKA